MPSGCPVERRVRICICRWKVLTNDVDLACKRPGFATAERPVGGPDTAAVGHRVDVGDEQPAVEAVGGRDAHGLALPVHEVVGLVHGEHDRAVVLDVRELGGFVPADKVDEAVRGVGVGEEVPATRRGGDGISDGRMRGAQTSKASRRRGGALTDQNDPVFNLLLLSSRVTSSYLQSWIMN